MSNYHRLCSSISAYTKVRQIKDANQEWWKTTERKTGKDRLAKSVRCKIKDFYIVEIQCSPSNHDVHNDKGGLQQRCTQ